MKGKKIKILFVAFPFSIHTSRWIGQLNNSIFEIHLFPSMDFQPLHNSISGIIYHEPFYNNLTGRVSGNKYSAGLLPQFPLLQNPLLKKLFRFIKKRETASERLELVIKRIKPAIIHSLETQHAGYLVSETKERFLNTFPFWIHSNWGIDLHFFGRLKSHESKIRTVLSQIDLFISEGERDSKLAEKFGFKRATKIFSSVGGGFVITTNSFDKPSSRKKILVKGSQDSVRRGLVALRALERCADILESYEILVYSADETVATAVELIRYDFELNMTIVNNLSHDEMMKLNGEARLNICVNLSDGVPNAMLEAMLMGAFPIQSNTSMAEEWIVNGSTGYIVAPQDPEELEKIIRKTLTNDTLVDKAAIINRKKIIDELEYHKVALKTLALYKGILSDL